ncbi:4Fe-4S binding protein [Caldicellulosiruptor changbaiensis]|uniref:4Fe-4S binding protein n=1 Tax=Caldicellulosiruptor changbaiensis TaxID=1222016 RepID=A0A3T0D7L7_9FIRM|nr:4Fe-4S binding protein [Caldicellulosiruptor changbaiensis]AZT91117.1 4Fe-4S binding protein [Caldicellulosiruptor changbaiensis]
MEVLEKGLKKGNKKKTEAKKLNYKPFVALLLPTVIIAGLFYPLMGLFAFVCMAGAVVLSFYKGRYWCYRFCPRGAFLDEFISKLSFQRSVPQILKSGFSKAFWVVFFMLMMALNVIRSGGDIYRFGKGVVLLLWLTSLLAIIGGILFKPRTWCIVCPMGTISGLVGKRKRPIEIDVSKCVQCKLCNKNCPMEIEVCSFKENGIVESINCIKCETCAKVCPKDALVSLD